MRCVAEMLKCSSESFFRLGIRRTVHTLLSADNLLRMSNDSDTSADKGTNLEEGHMQ